MRKLSPWFLLLAILTSAAFAQLGQYQGRLSPDDQKRFDSYYQRWLDNKRANDRDEVISMEKRMQDVMAHYHIPATVPYEAVASLAPGGRYGEYRARFSPDDQRRFDNHYQHWLDAKRANDRDEVIRTEERMQDLMTHHDIPLTVPYRALASNARDDDDRDEWRDRDRGHVRDWDDRRDRDEWREREEWRGKLQPEDQRHFDETYSRWLGYIRSDDGDAIRTMEKRMGDLKNKYNIPPRVPFNWIASESVAPRHSDLRILEATWGTGGNYKDVKRRLQAMVEKDRLTLDVSNTIMGGDPAPRAHNTLSLTYSYRGSEHHVSLQEGSTLNIP